MDKAAIVDVLEEIAVLLELTGGNGFKIRAYQNGARALETLEEDLDTLIGEGRLSEVNGIGEALAEKIATLRADERLPFYEDLRASVPEGMMEMLEIPGLGGKKVKKLHDALGVDSVDALEAACREGRVAEVPGFGAKTEQKLLTGIANRAAYAKRHLWWNADATARGILDGLRALESVERAEAAGSLRRLRETVGDLDFIVASSDPESVMEWFTGRGEVAEVTARGSTKASVRFGDGLQADLRVVSADQFPFALHHFTGSKDHNVAMRQRALDRGYSLSEWGFLDKGGRQRDGAASGKVRTEDDLFAFLGLAPIPPELREDAGELEAAERGALPRLVRAADLRGVFHNHTTASDGRAGPEAMAAAAAAYGWEYLGLADHSKASVQANGLDDRRVLEQVARIRELNASGGRDVHLFAGVECDILPDGKLDLEDATLEELDYAVMSVHSSFGLSEKAMTDRIIRALEHPATTMLGHPSGRLLLRREPYAVNLPKIIDAAIANRVVIEINANPRRLDLDWRYWHRAAERGLMCAINPDAHETEGLGYYSAGVNVARKGWLPPECVLNTRDCDGVRRWFAERR